MSLREEERRSIVTYRIERAETTLEEAQGVADHGWYNLSANRLYYAIYYAASALLIANGLPTKSHAGVKAMIHMHFVKTGILTLEEGALVGLLFSLRQSGDYEDFKQVTKSQIEELTPMVVHLVEKFKTLIQQDKVNG